MKAEQVDIVDENDNVTGESEKRSTAHERKLWHRHVLCWIMNEKGEILLQKRASTRKVNPNILGKIG